MREFIETLDLREESIFGCCGHLDALRHECEILVAAVCLDNRAVVRKAIENASETLAAMSGSLTELEEHKKAAP